MHSTSSSRSSSSSNSAPSTSSIPPEPTDYTTAYTIQESSFSYEYGILYCRIKDFSLLESKPGTCYNMPIQVAGAKMNLELFPGGGRPEIATGEVGIGIKWDRNFNGVRSAMTFSILTSPSSEGRRYPSIDFNALDPLYTKKGILLPTNHNGTPFSESSNNVWFNFSRDHLIKIALAADNQLILKMGIRHKEMHTEETLPLRTVDDNGKTRLQYKIAQRMSELLNHPKEADMVIKVTKDLSTKSASFPVHSLILKNMSPYFRNKIENFENENKDKKIEIELKNGYPQEFPYLLQYLYTGIIPDFNSIEQKKDQTPHKTAEEKEARGSLDEEEIKEEKEFPLIFNIALTARQCEEEELRIECENYLINALSLNNSLTNCYKQLEMVYPHKAFFRLKQACIEYIASGKGIEKKEEKEKLLQASKHSSDMESMIVKARKRLRLRENNILKTSALSTDVGYQELKLKIFEPLYVPPGIPPSVWLPPPSPKKSSILLESKKREPLRKIKFYSQLISKKTHFMREMIYLKIKGFSQLRLEQDASYSGPYFSLGKNAQLRGMFNLYPVHTMNEGVPYAQLSLFSSFVSNFYTVDSQIQKRFSILPGVSSQHHYSDELNQYDPIHTVEEVEDDHIPNSVLSTKGSWPLPLMMEAASNSSIDETIIKVELGFHSYRHIPIESKAKKNMQTLCISGEKSDITIKVSKNSLSHGVFKAHKFILKNRSDFFKTILGETTFAEAEAKEIELKDLSPDAFKYFLLYLYRLDESAIMRLLEDNDIKKEEKEELGEDLALEVALVADRFRENDLLIACEDYLINTLSQKNCGARLVAADKIGMFSPLKKACVQFIRGPSLFPQERKEIVDGLQEAFPTLAKELLDYKLGDGEIIKPILVEMSAASPHEDRSGYPSHFSSMHWTRNPLLLADSGSLSFVRSPEMTPPTSSPLPQVTSAVNGTPSLLTTSSSSAVISSAIQTTAGLSSTSIKRSRKWAEGGGGGGGTPVIPSTALPAGVTVLPATYPIDVRLHHLANQYRDLIKKDLLEALKSIGIKGKQGIRREEMVKILSKSAFLRAYPEEAGAFNQNKRSKRDSRTSISSLFSLSSSSSSSSSSEGSSALNARSISSSSTTAVLSLTSGTLFSSSVSAISSVMLTSSVMSGTSSSLSSLLRDP